MNAEFTEFKTEVRQEFRDFTEMVISAMEGFETRIISTMNVRFDAVDGRLTNVEARLDSLEKRTGSLEETVHEIQEDLRAGLKAIDQHALQLLTTISGSGA